MDFRSDILQVTVQMKEDLAFFFSMFLLEYLTESRLTSRGTAPPLCGGEELTCTCRSLPPVASRLDPRSEP